MEQAYFDAFSEVYNILKQMSKENVSKISNNFITFIEENRNKNYNPNLPPDILSNTKILKEETKIILSMIYRNYICSEEERKELEIQDEKYLREKYSYDNIFKNKKVEVDNSIQSTEMLDIQNIGKIKRFILSIKEKIIYLIKKK